VGMIGKCCAIEAQQDSFRQQETPPRPPLAGKVAGSFQQASQHRHFRCNPRVQRGIYIGSK
jgi:hypothetical protein